MIPCTYSYCGPVGGGGDGLADVLTNCLSSLSLDVVRCLFSFVTLFSSSVKEVAVVVTKVGVYFPVFPARMTLHLIGSDELGF